MPRIRAVTAAWLLVPATSMIVVVDQAVDLLVLRSAVSGTSCMVAMAVAIFVCWQ